MRQYTEDGSKIRLEFTQITQMLNSLKIKIKTEIV